MTFQFTYSPWWLILCFALGIGYAFLFYRKDVIIPIYYRYFVAFLRTIIVSILAALLLQPLFQFISQFSEQKKWVIAIDNSQSIQLINDSLKLESFKNNLEKIKQNLEDKGAEVEYRTLNSFQSLDSLKWNQPTSDLHTLLTDVRTDYEGRNLGGVILLSDGIVNRGLMPTYTHWTFPIHTIGVGDTTKRKDLILKSIYYNKIAYIGNKFPISVDIINQECGSVDAVVELKEGGVLLESKSIHLSNEKLTKIDFLLAALVKGSHRYTVSIKPIKNEFTTRNNQQSAIVDILDGKERILITANSPHPDIRTIRIALERNNNFETVVYIPGIHAKPSGKFDLLICHQVPSKNAVGNDILQLVGRQTPVLYILGAQTDFRMLNSWQDLVTFKPSGNQLDKVIGVFNTNFEQFSLSEEQKKIFNYFPPLDVPFGDYTTKSDANVILNQKIGSLTTQKPLLVTGKGNENKIAILMGEGIWRWQLYENSDEKNSHATDDLIIKLAQYLSSKEDKRKFRVFPTGADYFQSDIIKFQTELYNDIYEKTHGAEVNLSIVSESNKEFQYKYIITEGQCVFEAGTLPAGLYNYTARCTVAGVNNEVKGSFSVKELDLEALDLTANHDLLRQLSAESGGFFQADTTNLLIEKLQSASYKPRLHQQESTKEIIESYWLLVFLLTLLSVEWIVRKWQGSY